MRLVMIPLLVVGAVGLRSVSATEIGLDIVLIGNKDPIAGDNFDNSLFDSPPWFIVSGSPGPESGTTLTMDGGDFIFQSVSTNPFSNMTAYTLMQLTDFPAGSFASMILFGDSEGEFLSLGVGPGFAILSDLTGAPPLGVAGLPPSADANLLLTLDPLGTLHAEVNGVPVFDGTLPFGALTGIGISVVPEPATLGLLGLGCLFMGVRRRMFRS